MPHAVLSERPTGIMIPLYTDPPDPSYDDIIGEKNIHPSVPMIVIINPFNGPGLSKDPNYVTYIQRLQSSGIMVLGYVSTDYGNRNSTLIMADMDTYKNWYNTNGIFFDQMSNTISDEIFYSNLNGYAKSIGLNYTVGNPGAGVPASYIGTVDNLVVHENSSLPLLSLLQQYLIYPKTNFSTLSFGIDTLDTSFLLSESDYVGYTYVTNGNLPNQWNGLPSYFDTLVETLDGCSPPLSGDWIISQVCTLGSAVTAPANVLVQPGAVLTIPSGLKLNIDFTHYHLLVKSGGGVLIKAGGAVN